MFLARVAGPGLRSPGPGDELRVALVGIQHHGLRDPGIKGSGVLERARLASHAAAKAAHVVIAHAAANDQHIAVAPRGEQLAQANVFRRIQAAEQRELHGRNIGVGNAEGEGDEGAVIKTASRVAERGHAAER